MSWSLPAALCLLSLSAEADGKSQRTQATYVTRPAAFGPRIVADEGLHGSLLPISDFYRPPHGSASAACPYPDGPGWRADDEDAPLVLQRGGEVPEQPTLKPPHDWIALLERGGGCSFVSKVRVAQALGAKAVVVGDAPSPGWHRMPGSEGEADPGLAGRLLTMFAPGSTADVHVPSTFITRPSYVDLSRLVDELALDVEAGRAECERVGSCKDETRAKGLEIVLGRDDIMWEW